MKKTPSEWHAAICVDARTCAILLRKSLEDLDYTFKREKGEKYYDKWTVVINLPSTAYVFRFLVTEPASFNVSTYDTRPTHSGIYHIVEVTEITESSLPHIKRLLKHMAKKLPGKPYDIPFRERLMTGLLLSEFRKSKKQWALMGIH